VEKNGSVELMSEPVRQIVGKMPSALVRYGIFVLMGITIFLFVLAYTLKFPSPFVLSGIVGEKGEVVLSVSDKKRLDDLRIGALFSLLNTEGEQIYRSHLENETVDVYMRNGVYKVRIEGLIPCLVVHEGVRYLYEQGDRVMLRFEGKEIRLWNLFFQR